MSQVNVRTNPPAPRPPRRPPAWWPIAVFLVLVVIVALALIGRHLSTAGNSAATATPTAQIAASTATVAPAAAQATATASSSGTQATPTVGATATVAPPANPVALRVASGSCTIHAITWTWPAAARATAYELVLYDPRTGATIRDLTTSATRYQLAAGSGATVALKIRAKNAAGTAQGYFTPGSVGSVPPATTNPTAMSVSEAGHQLTWSWTGARHAMAYDFVLYHYVGGAAHSDITGRTSQGAWGTNVSPGISYYLKVRSVGACAPSGFFTPARGATAGATPTPGT